MSKVQLPRSIRFDSHIQMDTGNQKEDVSLSHEFKEHLTKKRRKDGVIDQEKSKQILGNKMDIQTVSCST